MRNFALILVGLALVFSCNTYEEGTSEGELVNTVCGVKDPAKNLPWISKMMEYHGEYCSVYSIYTGDYKGQHIIMVAVSGALCCTCSGYTIYDCEGNVIFSCNPDEEKRIADKKMIFKR